MYKFCPRCCRRHYTGDMYEVTLVTDDEQCGAVIVVCKNCAASLALCVPPMIEYADTLILHLMKEEVS